MQYQIVEAADSETLCALVGGLISEGWIPFGGVAVCGVFRQWENSQKGYTESDESYTYAQAMTKP